MKVVILCGGKGERMGEISFTTPKPLIPIGGNPVIWHIMKVYESYGFKDFVLCVGYKGEKIKEYFINNKNGWNIEFVDTGLESKKSERLAMTEPLISGENFFLSYGDDLCDVNIKNVLSFHEKTNKIVTLTAVRLASPFGIINTDKNGIVKEFKEKPMIDKWINGGYMAVNKKIFNHLGEGELESDIFKKLVGVQELCAYKHKGNWKSMTTLKDNTELNNLWSNGQAFWKVWKD